MQVDSGFIVTSSRSAGVPGSKSEAFEFLSAVFGATLPRGLTAVVVALPRDACSPLSEETVETIDDVRLPVVGGAAVLVRRGGCSFGAKAKNVQVFGGERGGKE